MSFNRTIAVGKGGRIGHGRIVSFQSLSKGSEIRNTRGVTFFEPGIKLIGLPLSHHRKELLGQLVDLLDIRFLANEGHRLLFFCSQLLWLSQKEKGAGVEGTLTDPPPYVVSQSAMGSQDLLFPAEESFFVLLEPHQRKLDVWLFLARKRHAQACPGIDGFVAVCIPELPNFLLEQVGILAAFLDTLFQVRKKGLQTNKAATFVG